MWMARPNAAVQRSRISSRLDRDLCVEERAVTAVSTPPCHKDRCVSSALQALQIATSSVAEAVWCGSARGACGWQDRVKWCRGRGWPRLLRGVLLLKTGCHRGEYANVLLAVSIQFNSIQTTQRETRRTGPREGESPGASARRCTEYDTIHYNTERSEGEPVQGLSSAL